MTMNNRKTYRIGHKEGKKKGRERERDRGTEGKEDWERCFEKYIL